MNTERGTRKQLGIEYGDIVTLKVHYGLVTGTVVKAGSSWTLTDHNAPEGYFHTISTSGKVEVVR